MSRPLLFVALDAAERPVALAVARRRADGRVELLADPAALADDRPLAVRVREADRRGSGPRTRAPAEVAALDAALEDALPQLGALLSPHGALDAPRLLDLAAHADAWPAADAHPAERALDVVFVGEGPGAALARELAASWHALGGGRYRVRARRAAPPVGRAAVLCLRGAGVAARRVAFGAAPEEALALAELAAEAFDGEDEARALGPASAWLSRPLELGGAGLIGAAWEAAALAARERLAAAFTHGEGGRVALADGGALELALSREAAAFALELSLVRGTERVRTALPLARFDPETWGRGPAPGTSDVLVLEQHRGLGWSLERRVDARAFCAELASELAGEELDLAALAAQEAAP